MYLVEHVSEVVGELDHLVVLLWGEVVEVEVARVNGFILVAHLVVQVRTGGLARVAHQRNHISSLDILPIMD